jgi:predicted deacylase
MPKKRSGSVVVGDLLAAPGECVRGPLPVAALPGQGMLELPVAIFNGARPGPRVWLSAAIHGDEINGVEVVREVAEAIDPAKLSGSVIAVPVVNVFGFFARSRYTPDRRDINRSFPGTPRGSLASRLAALFMREVASQCDLGIDLHTGGENRTNVPQIRCDLTDREQRRLARAFGAPVMLHNRPKKGTLRHACAQRKLPVLLYEAGEPHRFGRRSVRAGVHGIKRVMQALDMYAWRLEAPKHAPSEYWSSRWVRSPKAGLFRSANVLGKEVTSGEVLGTVGDALGETLVDVRAPFDGFVLGGAIGPIVHQGDALLHVASRRKPKRI